MKVRIRIKCDVSILFMHLTESYRFRFIQWKYVSLFKTTSH